MATVTGQRAPRNDAEILASCPDFISISGFFKAARPSTEGERRILYFEASNEAVDQQGEVIAAKALADSTDYYLRFGNVDLEHMSVLGPRLGIPDYISYEIGRPVAVKQTGKSTFVKAEIYRGDSAAATKANDFWASVTELQPPKPWYASVAGAILEKAVTFDPDTKSRKVIVKKVRWQNTALSATPVNDNISVCATVPVGAFAKCQLAGGLDIAKALEAGYGTDSAALTGGAALRRQSLYGAPINYFDFRNRIGRAVTAKGLSMEPAKLIEYAVKEFGWSRDEAAEHVERLQRDVDAGLKRRIN
jgi:hypothetical protein